MNEEPWKTVHYIPFTPQIRQKEKEKTYTAVATHADSLSKLISTSAFIRNWSSGGF